MKTFYTDGTGSEQTLNDSQTEKVVVYDTINDAEADLANLAEGQIIATKDEDFVDNATPVDEVTFNNMHSVTSNAVYEAIGHWEVLGTDNSTWIIRGMETQDSVYLQGHFQECTSYSSFSLPSKYRPKHVTRFYVYSGSQSKIVHVNINSNGTIDAVSGSIYGDFLVRIEKTIN